MVLQDPNKEQKRLSRYPNLEYTNITKDKFEDLADVLFPALRRTHYFAFYLPSETNISSETNVLGSKTKQCHSGARRSRGDLYRICRNYIPTITYLHFDDIINKLMERDKLFHNYCDDVERYVFHMFNYNKKDFRDFLNTNNLNLNVPKNEEVIA